MADPRKNLNVAGGLWQTGSGAPSKQISESERAKVVAGLWRKQIGQAQGGGGPGAPMPQPIAVQPALIFPNAPVGMRPAMGGGGTGVGMGTEAGEMGGAQLVWPSMPVGGVRGVTLISPGVSGGVRGTGGIGLRMGGTPIGGFVASQAGVRVRGDGAWELTTRMGVAAVPPLSLKVPGSSGTERYAGRRSIAQDTGAGQQPGGDVDRVADALWNKFELLDRLVDTKLADETISEEARVAVRYAGLVLGHLAKWLRKEETVNPSEDHLNRGRAIAGRLRELAILRTAGEQVSRADCKWVTDDMLNLAMSNAEIKVLDDAVWMLIRHHVNRMLVELMNSETPEEAAAQVDGLAAFDKVLR